MKKQILLVMALLSLAFSACKLNVPATYKLTDQTLLLAENRDIKANFQLRSDVKNGAIPYITVKKNGKQYIDDDYCYYDSETVFNKMWSNYISAKFNSFSDDVMDVVTTLKEVKIENRYMTTEALDILLSYSRENVAALITIAVEVNYHGKKFEKQYQVEASAFNRTDAHYTSKHHYNIVQKEAPEQQISTVLEECFNSSIVQFENFLRQIITADKKNNN